METKEKENEEMIEREYKEVEFTSDVLYDEDAYFEQFLNSLFFIIEFNNFEHSMKLSLEKRKAIAIATLNALDKAINTEMN